MRSINHVLLERGARQIETGAIQMNLTGIKNHQRANFAAKNKIRMKCAIGCTKLYATVAFEQFLAAARR